MIAIFSVNDGEDVQFSIFNNQCSREKGECRTDEQGILNVEELGWRGLMMQSVFWLNPKGIACL
jgi:hypothetical protein